jgi:integrase
MPIISITKDMVEQRHYDLTVTPNRLGTSGHGRANNALKKLSALINFAADRFGTEEEPLIKINPVSRLSKNRSWHRIYPRQGIIADSRLKLWYRAVRSLHHDVARDFFIFLLLTGMRFGETRKLKWSYVDFKRRIFNRTSDWIFQSTRLSNQPISGGTGILHKVRAESGIRFTFHDLRRYSEFQIMPSSA